MIYSQNDETGVLEVLETKICFLSNHSGQPLELFKDKENISKTIKSDMLQTRTVTYYLRSDLMLILAVYALKLGVLFRQISSYCSHCSVR